MRIIPIFRKLFVSLLLSACAVTRAAGQAGDSLAVARRIVAATALAAKEYAAGVVPRGGRVTAAAEVDEARQFLEQARLDAPALPARVRAVADTELALLRAMVERAAPPDSVAARANALVARIAAAAGGALDPFPTRPPSLARGAAIYGEQCLQCHGPTGRGDGPKAKQLEGPAPASLADPQLMRNASPVDVYRKVTIGVAGTAMPQFEETLSPEDRWAVATYIATLRTAHGDEREGEGLYAVSCAACHGAVGGGAPVRDQPLRALEPGEQARVDRIQLLGPCPGGGTGAQGGERVLELAGEGGIPGAYLRLHLLEGEVGVERQLARPERHRGIDLAPHRREGRRCG